jgi:hypothetical protein
MPLMPLSYTPKTSYIYICITRNIYITYIYMHNKEDNMVRMLLSDRGLA